MTSKQEFRQLIKERKSKVCPAQHIKEAIMVKEKIEQLQWFNYAQNILSYHSLPDEISTHIHLNDWYTNKNLYLPRVNELNLEIIKYNPSQIKIGAFNAYEPIGTPTSPQEMDLIIVPGIAFDKNGNRMGRGTGYYDKLLTNCNAPKIGIGYDFQLFDNIPSEPHDVKMDAIITPSNIIILNTPAT